MINHFIYPVTKGDQNTVHISSYALHFFLIFFSHTLKLTIHFNGPSTSPYCLSDAVIAFCIFLNKSFFLPIMHQFLHFNCTLSDILEAKSTGEFDSHVFWCLEQPMGAVQLEQIWLWNCRCRKRNVFLYVLVGSFAASWYCQSSVFIYWTLCSTKASLLSSDFITKTPVTPALSPRYQRNMVSVWLNCRQLLCSRRKKPLLTAGGCFHTSSHQQNSVLCPTMLGIDLPNLPHVISISDLSRRICHLVKVDNKAVFSLWWFFSLLAQSWLKSIKQALLDCQREDDCNLCSLFLDGWNHVVIELLSKQMWWQVISGLVKNIATRTFHTQRRHDTLKVKRKDLNFLI